MNLFQYVSAHDVMGTPYKIKSVQWQMMQCTVCETQPCLCKWKYGIIHSEYSVFRVVRTTACSASCERVFIHKLIKDWFILAHFLQWIDRLTPCLWDSGLVLWCSRLIIMSVLWALEYVFTPLWRFSIPNPVWDCGSSLVPQILKCMGHYFPLRLWGWQKKE